MDVQFRQEIPNSGLGLASRALSSKGKLRIAFVTNICPHYRVRTYEVLSKYFQTVYYFFSAGDEWYWQQKHGTRMGRFVCEYLRGVSIFGTRITPSLFQKLLRSRCDVYIKCINGRLALPVTYAAARLRRKPFILWTGIWMRLNSRFHRWFYPVTRYIYTHSDAVVTYGTHVKQFLVSQGVPEERIFVAHHAVDNALYGRDVSQAERGRLRDELNLGIEDRVVLYLGRLEHNKGVRYLIEAFRSLSLQKCVLVLVGEGAESELLRAEVCAAGIGDRVRFVGYVPPEDTPPYYALATVSVLPSITTETSKELWGLVVNEAMNQGCPFIVTDAVGAAAGGLVRDRLNGMIVPEADTSRLAMAIEEVVENPAFRHAMSQSAKQAITGWDNERMVAGFRQAVEYVVQQRRQGNA
jgi:glycosyltransferase involved in cell wall biosynthesis